MSEVLEALFGSKARTRLIRFFLLNDNQDYEVSELMKRTLLRSGQVRKELNSLKKIKFIKEAKRKGIKYYSINPEFPFHPELKGLIAKSNVYPQCRSLGRISGIGDVKLAMVSGVFLNYPKSKADMVLVVDSVSRARLNSLISNIEAEIGKEISYVLMTSDELKYRMNMMDRFLMGFFEGPYDEVINKVSGFKRFLDGIKK